MKSSVLGSEKLMSILIVRIVHLPDWLGSFVVSFCRQFVSNASVSSQAARCSLFIFANLVDTNLLTTLITSTNSLLILSTHEQFLKTSKVALKSDINLSLSNFLSLKKSCVKYHHFYGNISVVLKSISITIPYFSLFCRVR